MNTDIRAVIFDFGRVLSLPQDAAAVERMAAACRLSPEVFEREYYARRLDLDQGAVTVAAYWGRLLALGGVEPSPQTIRRLSEEDTRSWVRMNPRLMGWAEELRAAGLGTAILSNMPADTVKWLNREAAWLSDFSVRIFSSDVDLVKPGEGIYRLCLSRLGLPADRTLFLDDMPVNTEAAGRVGMRTILFRTADQAAREAGAMGLPVTRF